ncbi:sphingosine kinase [Marinococcus halophilus]|uniref:Diacylglycerol kinase n=1 Tax=Marinococcus halophilus TaxID=1371 RepID=A0A510Y4F8_MARHA|nr:diacylglycerol kinase family protein [Marinococcus halophilus]OZT80167.1 sphingosine kinase [Marinococcus halophilus]GEK58219.1 diacylglycerol kinase [Marinococcus halophilus]
MSKAMLIINPSSGKADALSHEAPAIKVLQELYDNVTIRYTEKAGDAKDLAQQACEQRFDALVTLGGDGTVNESVNGLAEQPHQPAFGFLPLGTVNDFARALQLPLDPSEAIEVIRQQHTIPVDIGKVDRTYFMNVLAIGAIAEAVYDVSPEQKSAFGPLAYVLEGTKAFRHHTPFALTLEHDQGVWEGDAYLALVALTNSVGGIESLAPQAKVHDGCFHVFIVKRLGLTNIAQMIPELLQGSLSHHEDIEYFATATLRASTAERHIFNIDGDEGRPLPFDAAVLPHELRIFVPPDR